MDTRTPSTAVRRQLAAELRRQLHHLADAAGRDGVTVRVLPFEAGVHAAMAGAFTVFGFPPGTADCAACDPVVHTETLIGRVLRTRHAEVRLYRDAFADLCRRALDPVASRALIDGLSREHALS